MSFDPGGAGPSDDFVSSEILKLLKETKKEFSLGGFIMKILVFVALFIAITALYISIGHATVLAPVTDSVGNTGTIKVYTAGEQGAIVNNDGLKVGGEE